MCSPGIVSTVVNPIGAISRAIGGPVGKILDPAASIGQAIGGPIGTLVDPAKLASGLVSGQAFAPPQPARSNAGVVGNMTPSAPSVTPYKPSANNYSSSLGTAPQLNTYASGMNQSGIPQYSTAGSDLGPYNQGGQKAVKKVVM